MRVISAEASQMVALRGEAGELQFSLEQRWLRGDLAAAPCVCREVKEEMELGSSQWCRARGQEMVAIS